MIVLVTGGRTYGVIVEKPGMSGPERVFAEAKARREVATLRGVLDRLHAVLPIELIIHGNARGADTAAGLWALHSLVAVKKYPADWDTLGKAAGIIRNEFMFNSNINSIDLVLVFPGGPGTAHMTKHAEDMGRINLWDGFVWQI